MTESERRSKTIATVGTLAIIALVLLALTPAATADAGPYTIEQGDQCIDVDSVGNGSQTVEEFYDYKSNETDPEGEFSSYGTQEYQRDNTSTMLLYDGSEGTSLVFVHEKLHEPAEDGTNGSSITFNVSGISPGDAWAVEDDDYTNLDDTFEHGETYSKMNWVWGQGRTDGGAYRGLDNDTDIQIDPAFNEDADERYDGYKYTGWVHDWEVAEGTSDDERTELGSLEESVTVQSGYCADAPTADLEVNDPTPPTAVGETVTLDAGGSEADAEIDRYEWDFGSNGTVDETTNESEISHEFDSAGEHDVNVTVVDIHGQTGSESRSVEVVNETPPNASVDAPENGDIREELTFDGTESKDEFGIERYEWDFGDGNTAEGESSSTTHVYDTPGTYTVELTAYDGSNGSDTSNATVVVDPVEPTADLDAPEPATVNETVTLSANGSDAGPSASYEWTINNGTSENTTDPVYNHTFASNGTHHVQVNVSDEYGYDTAETTIEVTESSTPSGPTAALDEVEDATAGSEVHFDANASDDVVSYEWDFGDGNMTEGESSSTTHVYDTPGTYTVELTVFDGSNDSDTSSATVVIDSSDSPESDPPTARLDVPDDPTEGMLTMNASRSEAGDNVTFDWFLNGDHKDEDYADDPEIFKTGFSASEHHVRVQVTDDGGSDNATATITVDPAVEAALDVPDDAIVGETVTLDASDSTVNGTASYEWIVDDTPENTTTKPTYNYTVSEAREYDVRVNVTNDDGHNDAATAAITVEEETDDSGGSGGYVPSPPPSEPVETSAEIVNGTLVVTAEGGIEAGEPFDVDLSTEDSIAPDVIGHQSVEVTPAEDAETMTIEFEPTARDVPGRFSESSAFVANASRDVEAVTYEFAVGDDVLDAAGVSPDNVTAYASEAGDEWTAIETDVEDDGDDVVVSATADGDAVLGLGATGSALFVSGVETDGVTRNGMVDLVATVRNTGTERGEATIPIDVGDEEPVRESVALDAGEETVIETSVPSTADATVRVGGVRRGLAIVAVTDLAVTSSPAVPGESTTVETTLVNDGSAAGEFDAELVVDGEVATTETVAIGPGERTTLAFDHRFEAAGSYDLAVGNATASVDVEERDSFDGGGAESQSGATSGFGALAALLAAAVVILGLVGAGRLGKRP